MTNADPPTVVPSSPNRIAAFIESRLRILLFALYAVGGLSFAGPAFWMFDNLTAFVPQYAGIAFLFAIGFGLLRSPRWAVAALVLAGAHALRLWVPGAEPAPIVGQSLKVVSANVHTSNREYDRFLRFVKSESPDLLLVTEVDDGWVDALEPLRGEYPHAVIEPRSDNFGIALLSRLPVDTAETVELGDAGVPTIVARVTLGEEPLTIIGTHPLPPVRSATARERNRQLAAVAQRAADDSFDVIVMGDLNASPWSPYFRALLREGRLSDTRRGFDLQPTWPAFFAPLMTPIDHILISDGLNVTDRRTGPNIGSDHRPVMATIWRRSGP
ncbi:MAG: endonuclease/exonuclease/phosphatase family protein [Planctomycetota bacterium]|nr:endonuclease/exonuclease/phosphatase family protein [Planctomycetaceae bacterium]MDQ3329572.1 endonuclease/exonuclease/phosphatase family protein [Planctomycetota bacterium]